MRNPIHALLPTRTPVSFIATQRFRTLPNRLRSRRTLPVPPPPPSLLHPFYLYLTCIFMANNNSPGLSHETVSQLKLNHRSRTPQGGDDRGEEELTWPRNAFHFINPFMYVYLTHRWTPITKLSIVTSIFHNLTKFPTLLLVHQNPKKTPLLLREPNIYLYTSAGLLAHKLHRSFNPSRPPSLKLFNDHVWPHSFEVSHVECRDLLTATQVELAEIYQR